MSPLDPAAAPLPTAPHVSARSAILGRTKRLKDRLVLVADWGQSPELPDGLPSVTRMVRGDDGEPVEETGNVLCRELNAGVRADLLQHAIDDRGQVILRRIYPDLVVLGALHPETEVPLFVATDRDALLTERGSIIETVATAVGDLSGLNDKSHARRVEGNSGATATSDSATN